MSASKSRTIGRRVAMAGMALGATLGLTGCYATPEGGNVVVVRNGGPVDQKQVREVLPSTSGKSWVGFGSENRSYPAADQQRTYKNSDGARDADDGTITVPTKDGVRVKITSTLYLFTAFTNDDRGERLVKKFDEQFGTREFNGKRVFDPDGGFGEFLKTSQQPVIDATIRSVVGRFECKELVSSCALIQRGEGGQVSLKAADTNPGRNLDRVQEEVQRALAANTLRTLGQPYFRSIKFTLGTPELPGVQADIDKAQAAGAQVSVAQAKVGAARAEAEANARRQRGYDLCKTCGDIDRLKALPRNLQALGGDTAVGLK